MRKAIAIWNYCWDASALVPWIHDFAAHGFDAVSLHPGQFAGDRARHLPAVAEALRARGLAATVHGSVTMDPGQMETLVQTLGESLAVFSMDSALREDSRGRLHDAGLIAAALSRLQQLTAGTDIRIAVEDFPLDALALQHFAEELGDVYRHPRTGILIDVGHMHMRMRNPGPFRGMPVTEYFSRLPVPLAEVHLHDNNGEKDQHGHFGFGTVPFGEVAGALKRLAFDGVCTIEIAPTFHGSTPAESRPKALASLAIWDDLMRTAGAPPPTAPAQGAQQPCTPAC